MTTAAPESAMPRAGSMEFRRRGFEVPDVTTFLLPRRISERASGTERGPQQFRIVLLMSLAERLLEQDTTTRWPDNEAASVDVTDAGCTLTVSQAGRFVSSAQI